MSSDTSLSKDQKIEAVEALIRALASDTDEAAEISHRLAVIFQLESRGLRPFSEWQGEFVIETGRISEQESIMLRDLAQLHRTALDPLCLLAIDCRRIIACPSCFGHRCIIYRCHYASGMFPL